MSTQTTRRFPDALPALRPLRGAVSVRGVVLGLLTFLWRLQARAERRYTLAEMDDRQLRDVGLTRQQLSPEIRKPFWQG
ncbi:MAG: DUF1127 domain-containing protein [Alphaproteobacteria bacterium]|nr:DUF1127 domain-containing protein [Alphaproteobacteria bacterium]MBU0795920.1 DUF1127 domain-containing protein [Alphaproteobacteria bacterium]MBU0886957.1 DUF1127 domain-containing protein [Alphaproteobacteria bacterium]MBU1813187.1 DUF1127 domain-containing protein [Alphaproteobacteria bacterium]MBU2090608.1 DUF1127 domain-containing protein [Alphaproteobacteria bacterium]